MALLKDIVKCICLCVVFLLICIFILWPKNKDLQDEKYYPPENTDTSLPSIVDHIATTNGTVPPTKQTTVTIVSTTQELQEALKNPLSGDVLQLSDGVYTGKFILNQTDLVIRGTGPGTIIKLNDTGTRHQSNACALHILGNRCEVRDLKIVSDETGYTLGILVTGLDNSVSNVEFDGLNFAFVSNNRTKLSNVQVRNTVRGFTLRRSTNSLNDIKLENITGVGVQILGNNNTVDSFTCVKCAAGILITGDDNVAQHLEIRDSIPPSKFWKVFGKGKRNLVQDFKCDEACLKLHTESANSTIRNGVLQMAQVDGVGHNLFNLDAGSLLQVQGSWHRIEKSKADKFVNTGTNVSLIGKDNIFGVME